VTAKNKLYIGTCKLYISFFCRIVNHIFKFVSDVNECLNIQCLNNGACVNVAGTYQCECKPGFTGTFCGQGKLNSQVTNIINLYSSCISLGMVKIKKRKI